MVRVNRRAARLLPAWGNGSRLVPSASRPMSDLEPFWGAYQKRTLIGAEIGNFAPEAAFQPDPAHSAAPSMLGLPDVFFIPAVCSLEAVLGLATMARIYHFR
jgi:hypothetical protein